MARKPHAYSDMSPSQHHVLLLFVQKEKMFPTVVRKHLKHRHKNKLWANLPRLDLVQPMGYSCLALGLSFSILFLELSKPRRVILMQGSCFS